MKTQICKFKVGLLLMAVLCDAFELSAQTSYIAYQVPAGTVGNQAIDNLVVGNDFHVVSPITIRDLGVFTSGTNGIQNGAVLTVQLFERSGRHLGTLLETLTFDAATPGRKIGGSLFKPLPIPLTLLPGNYTITAYGFDTNNPEGNAGKRPYTTNTPPWKMDSGGGLISFEGQARYGYSPGQYPGHLDRGPANRYAAGTFVFSAGTLPSTSYAADYAALTAGVTTFPVEDTRHLGSIAVLDTGAFPVLVEQGGNRLVMEAAGVYNSDPNGGRAVVFSHTQWMQPREQTPADGRLTLFENAIKWTSRKSSPAQITIGITTTNVNVPAMTNFNVDYFLSRGYHLIPIDFETLDTTNGLPKIDVLVINGHARYLEKGAVLIDRFLANGGGLVMSMIPRFVVYPKMRPAFEAANEILQPFNLAYRSSLAVPTDFGFTTVQAAPFPTVFGAFPAAQMLFQDRKGNIQLNSQQKAIALNTINYTVNARPDLLPYLTAVYSTGSATNLGVSQPTGSINRFVDTVVLAGSQGTNALGQWVVDGADLVAQDRRGAVEYNFNVPAADVYRLQIDGIQNLPINTASNFDLVLSVDGVNLGHHTLQAPYGFAGVANCFTPYLPSGTHTLRVLWDNAANYTALRLRSIRVQTGLGPDADGDGIKDWVEQYIGAQSGMDNTNEIISSYTSPICLEGRDPYLSLMQLNVESSDNRTPQVQARLAGYGRWYADVPLSAYVNGQTILQASYQNGALVETHTLQWAPINLLDNAWAGKSITIRKGDRLLLNALPNGAPNGALKIVVGTNSYAGRTTQPIACNFPAGGLYSVTGTYTSPQAGVQSGNISVNVIEQNLTNKPACWVGRERTWDLKGLAAGVVLQADSRLFMEQTGTIADNGQEFNMLIDRNEPRCIIARLGASGPILDSTRARGFNLWGAGDTYLKIIQRYQDGSQLVEMLLIMSPMLPDLVVQLDTIVGGVVFDDGTVTKTLSASDFNGQGACKVRFIRPATARTSTCHTIKVFQDSELIGYVR